MLGLHFANNNSDEYEQFKEISPGDNNAISCNDSISIAEEQK